MSSPVSIHPLKGSHVSAIFSNPFNLKFTGLHYSNSSVANYTGGFQLHQPCSMPVMIFLLEILCVSKAKARACQHRFKEATHRTTRWLDRCIAGHKRPSEQNLFAIVQGGLDPELRDISLRVSQTHPCPGIRVPLARDICRNCIALVLCRI